MIYYNITVFFALDEKKDIDILQKEQTKPPKLAEESER